MSTIAKLDSNVRRRRSDRRSLIVALSRGNLTISGMALVQVLDGIRRRSSRTGAWKAELFEDALTRYEQKYGLDKSGREALKA